MSRFDLVPEETLFIDDREDNIQAAENLGFQTIHLTDPSTIKSDIKKFLVV
jgi:FMN phosphatase YigB (HAD superfamily)